MSLTTIRDLSNRYGADPSFVLAGGGNTSYKDEKYLYVKPSGVALAEIRESDFVRMERETIRKVFSLSGYADNVEREAMVTKLMAFAVADSAARRPSVEAPLHELMPFTYIVHLHPAMVNGLTCSKKRRKGVRAAVPGRALVPETDPGFILAKTVYDASVQYEKEHGKPVSMIFLQNHGVSSAAIPRRRSMPRTAGSCPRCAKLTRRPESRPGSPVSESSTKRSPSKPPRSCAAGSATAKRP